jgi:hypothetical protein
VQRNLFSRRSFAADGDSTNSGEVFAVLDIQIADEACPPSSIAATDSRKPENQCRKELFAGLWPEGNTTR